MTVAWAAQVQHPGAGARTSTAQAGELGNVRYEEAFNSARRLVAQHCVGPAGQQKRRNVWADFEAWLSSGVSPRTVESCTPSDIVVYMQMEYLPNHQGSVTASGESCCAPSSVEQVLSHLKACFANELRRSDRWSTVAEQSGLARGCNPAWSYDVEVFKKSYRNYAVNELRFREVSATPVDEAQLGVVLLSLAQAAWGGGSPLEAALAARDGAMLCIMWATMMRGHEVGGLQLSGLLLLDGSSAVSSLFPEVKLQAGQEWLIKPVSSKTEKANVVQPRRVQFGAAVGVMDPAFWVYSVLRTAAYAGQPIVSYLFRPLARDRQRFQNAALESSALNHAFKKRFAGAGVLDGQTPHGMRRGAIQAGRAAGRSAEDVMAQAHMKSPSVFQRYTDPLRHRLDR